MNSVLKFVLIVFISCFTCLNVFSAETKLLTAEITMVPETFLGTWRVVSKLSETDSPAIFKENNIDLWNLNRVGNVITLRNPSNGASADITVDKATQNYVVFSKTGKNGNKILTDTVEITITGNNFIGNNTLKLDTYSDVNGKIIKTETAKYAIKGEKISGQSIVK